MTVELINQAEHSQSNYIIRKQGRWVSFQDKEGLSYRIVDRTEVVGITAGGASMTLLLKGGGSVTLDVGYRAEMSVKDNRDEYQTRSIEHAKFEIKRIVSFFFENGGLNHALLGY